jgi:hypothetical protein
MTQSPDQQPLFPSASQRAIQQIVQFAEMANDLKEDDILDAIGTLFLIEKQTKAARRELVYDARRQGISWEKIGDSMNLSKQAVHRMYAENAPEPAEKDEEEEE